MNSRRSLLFPLLVTLAWLAALPAPGQLSFPTANGLVTTQTSLSTTALPNGNNLWTTFLDVSNANSFPFPNVYLVVNARLHNAVTRSSRA